jgi:hypothetical protein
LGSGLRWSENWGFELFLGVLKKFAAVNPHHEMDDREGMRQQWLVELQDMLRRRSVPTETLFHAYLGVHSNAAVWLFLYLAPRWPANAAVPHTQRGLMWTLWFLRDYPTERHIIEVVRTCSVFYRVVWFYVAILARVLPQVC